MPNTGRRIALPGLHLDLLLPPVALAIAISSASPACRPGIGANEIRTLTRSPWGEIMATCSHNR